MGDRRNPTLKKVLKYRNDFVIERFAQEHGLTKRVANTIFLDMLRFLWLSNHINFKKKSPISSLLLIEPWLIIDEMWHTFILFNEEYEAFGLKYFGRKIIHRPDTTLYVNPKNGRTRVDYSTYVDVIYDNLGQNIANRWFETYRKKYTLEKIILLKLKAVRSSVARNKKQGQVHKNLRKA